MANELENTLKDITTKVTKYVDDLSKMTVVTQYTVISEEDGVKNSEPQDAARTEIRFDGDSVSVVPMRRTDNGLELDQALYQLHQQNVAAATEYRTRVLGALVGALQSLFK
ncbi:MAG: hypothetical protein HXX20_22815 [Chloroflexi bacterium]|nr:hypothetical protein [Chloroflexota bacterium]